MADGANLEKSCSLHCSSSNLRVCSLVWSLVCDVWMSEMCEGVCEWVPLSRSEKLDTEFFTELVTYCLDGWQQQIQLTFLSRQDSYGSTICLAEGPTRQRPADGATAGTDRIAPMSRVSSHCTQTRRLSHRETLMILWSQRNKILAGMAFHQSLAIKPRRILILVIVYSITKRKNLYQNLGNPKSWKLSVSL